MIAGTLDGRGGPIGMAALPARTFLVHPGTARGRLRAPPSKSYSHRALLVGALAEGPLLVKDLLLSEDTAASVRAVRALGGEVAGFPLPSSSDRPSHVDVEVRPFELDLALTRSRPSTVAEADVGESGTTLRLFTASAPLSQRRVRFVGADGLARRPLGDLLQALDQLGASRQGPPPGRSLPFEIEGPLHAGAVEVRGDLSSQFISSLLLALPLLSGPSRLRVAGARVSEPYLAATLAVQRSRGLVVQDSQEGYDLPGGQRYRGGRFEVPGDASSAAYPLALAAITGGSVRVEGLPRSWPQADLALLDLLRWMGCRVRQDEGSVEVEHGSRPLEPFEADLDPSPDLAPLLTVLAAFAQGESVLRGGAHLVAKESDRRSGALLLSRALGVEASDEGGAIRIRGPTRSRRLELLSLTDHRMLFAATVAAAALPEASRLGDARSAAKSYPGFLADLASIGIRTEGEPGAAQGRDRP